MTDALPIDLRRQAPQQPAVEKGATAVGAVLEHLQIPQTYLVRGTGLSRSVVSRIVAHDRWPARGEKVARQAVITFLKKCGAPMGQLRDLILPTKNEAPSASTPEASNPHEPVKTPEEDPMLLEKHSLTQQACERFGLVRSMFTDEVQSPADVYASPSVRYVRKALMDCAAHHGFLGVVAQSGAGKSTLAVDLEERIRAEARDILVIRPYIVGMEQNDTKGKTLKASHIAEAAGYALDPQMKVKSSPQQRYAQLHAMLKESHRAGRRHLVLIEEAHCLPTETLKHLKRFLELQDGMRRLMGVALIAQPELRERLNSQNPQVREVMQRCELIELEPLDQDLEPYLRFKFKRAGVVEYDSVFAADAADAIRARLIHIPRGAKASEARSICHPQVVQNLIQRAINAAALNGWEKVDAQCIAGC